MGGVPKPELILGGRSMVRRVLDAVPQASPRIVVGDLIARDFTVTVEDLPGAGPAYAAVAGLEHVPHDVPLVVLLAADLPFLNPEVSQALLAAVTEGKDGAVLIDHAGRRQWLCGTWRQSSLRRLAADVVPGMGMRQMLGRLDIAEVAWWDSDLPPWFDCDTPAAFEYAKRLEQEFPQRLPAAGSQRHEPATVDVQGDSGDESGRVAGQEEDRINEFGQ